MMSELEKLQEVYRAKFVGKKVSVIKNRDMSEKPYSHKLLQPGDIIEITDIEMDNGGIVAVYKINDRETNYIRIEDIRLVEEETPSTICKCNAHSLLLFGHDLNCLYIKNRKILR